MTELQALNIIITAFLTAVGACFGSFINAASLRYAAGASFVKGRSCCPACGAVIKWFDLVPIASWLLLAGKCRGCKAKIPLRYALVEVLAAVLFPLCYIVFGFKWMTLIAMAVTFILLAISLIDLATTEIPNGLTIALIPLAIAAIWLAPDVTLVARIIGFFAISLPMFILALCISGAFGGGDIKLMAVCGFLLGWQNVLLAFFIALVFGGGYAIMQMAVKKRKGQMVFGPALAAGVYIALLFGENVVGWYLNFFVSF